MFYAKNHENHVCFGHFPSVDFPKEEKTGHIKNKHKANVQLVSTSTLLSQSFITGAKTATSDTTHIEAAWLLDKPLSIKSLRKEV